MIQAIFYKEWIKTRWYLLLATLFMIGITGYSMLRIGRTIAIQGIDHLWVVMVQKDAIFIDLLQFVPLLTGILLAAVQFLLRVLLSWEFICRNTLQVSWYSVSYSRLLRGFWPDLPGICLFHGFAWNLHGSGGS